MFIVGALMPTAANAAENAIRCTVTGKGSILGRPEQRIDEPQIRYYVLDDDAQTLWFLLDGNRKRECSELECTLNFTPTVVSFERHSSDDSGAFDKFHLDRLTGKIVHEYDLGDMGHILVTGSCAAISLDNRKF